MTVNNDATPALDRGVSDAEDQARREDAEAKQQEVHAEDQITDDAAAKPDGKAGAEPPAAPEEVGEVVDEGALRVPRRRAGYLSAISKRKAIATEGMVQPGDDGELTLSANEFNEIVNAQQRGEKPAAPRAEQAAETQQPRADAAPEPQQPGAQPAGAPAQPGAEPQGDHVLKVYGKEQRFSYDELVQHAQRGLAADQKFQRADEMLRAANTLMDRYNKAQGQPGAQPAEQQPSDQPTPAHQQPALDAAAAADLAKRIQYGSEEESGAAIQELVQAVASSTRPEQPGEPIDQGRLVAATAAQVREQQAHADALQSIASEYPDVFADRGLAHLAGERVIEERARVLTELGYPGDHLTAALSTAEGRGVISAHFAEHQRRGNAPSDLDLYRRSVQPVHDRFIAPFAAKENDTPNPATAGLDRSEHQRAKEGIVPLPTPATAAERPAPEAKPKTKSEVVAEMRAARKGKRLPGAVRR